jgi:hypothetical protein
MATRGCVDVQDKYEFHKNRVARASVSTRQIEQEGR